MTNSDFQAYCFDLDGTLLNTTPDIAHAINMMRASMGLSSLSEAEVERGVGRGATELILATTPTDLHSEVKMMRERFVIAYEARLCVDTHPYHGAQHCLERLKEREKRIALVTNKPERLAIPLLNALGWQDLFDVKLYGDSLPERKPSPKPLLKTADLLNIDVSNCVFIGDTEVDARASSAVPMEFRAVSWGRIAPSVAQGDWGTHAQVLREFSDLILKN